MPRWCACAAPAPAYAPLEGELEGELEGALEPQSSAFTGERPSPPPRREGCLGAPPHHKAPLPAGAAASPPQQPAPVPEPVEPESAPASAPLEGGAAEPQSEPEQPSAAIPDHQGVALVGWSTRSSARTAAWSAAAPRRRPRR